ncbi:MOSC domain-containing protein [Mycobacterium deserti]|uniref:MOSC domain-containing protein n=1 Tax=Mycobacterium deserti TaxID=2978347 RepID=A0ABT2MEY0_9MYCO|nr:MOSC domain-containing protein [Mycobacterium deserti]MCT7660823.1 MOSC domain-containing protein [Mycobacterium deserti]
MTVTTVRTLWRYPVKSMGGEEVSELEIGRSGVVGDRVFGVFDVGERRLASAKRARQYGKLLECRVRLVGSTESDDSTIEVTFPDGSVECGIEKVSRRTSELLGREVRIVASGDPVAQDFLAMAASSTFADLAPVHVLSTGILGRMAAAYPGGVWDARRFRPNLLLDGADLETDDMLGCDLVSTSAVLHAVMPTPRCVMTTLAQDQLPHDADILRAVAGVDRRVVPVLGEKPCAGVYADVVQGGIVRRGDSVRLDRVTARHGALASVLQTLEQRG